MSRIKKTFENLKINKKKALGIFLTAGDPDLETSLDMLINHGFSAKSLILLNSIYPIRVSDALLDKAKAGNGYAADFIIKFGLYRAIVRYIGFKALWAIIQAVSLFALSWGVIVLMSGIQGVPRSVIIINWIIFYN